ncbi:unnamed protein product [Heligmosomoides polygyrus]|uniref:Uncharacterized protein n=1 Tax=Heligmosomoides polygyrus TaxID=6339 RepID=A0A183G5T8_HELPZ|nr:unnamed protein product [Heligmosomoides polygyrus]
MRRHSASLVFLLLTLSVAGSVGNVDWCQYFRLLKRDHMRPECNGIFRLRLARRRGELSPNNSQGFRSVVCQNTPCQARISFDGADYSSTIKGSRSSGASLVFSFNVALMELLEPSKHCPSLDNLIYYSSTCVLSGHSCRVPMLVLMKEAFTNSDSVSFHFRLKNFPRNQNGRTTKVASRVYTDRFHIVKRAGELMRK